MKSTALWLLILSIAMCVAGYALALGVSCSALQSRVHYCEEIAKFAKYYVENIRGHLFAGFLALGGFLLSLKTFIVVTMKENVYDDEKYIQNWEAQRKLDPQMSLSEILCLRHTM
ncbi:hypothetical protein [Denitromonas iodatirespirans]|uniref:Uncharacterized protein n=1 Tax=Denitromonas iodatirespirans TaxID=2795389 RepID=A0A944DJA0_DENI1|nr:hypothetical protein [Denitromonas iodatirespirans]MBT0959869.1 hypothetical protein [Denitromonas iodatirespirans]